jgi:hypothetical protein
MFNRLRLSPSAALLLGGLLCGLALGRPSIGQTPTTPRPPDPSLPGSKLADAGDRRGGDEPCAAGHCKGHYQAVGTGGLSYTVVIDTVTGECWALYPAARDPNLSVAAGMEAFSGGSGAPAAAAAAPAAAAAAPAAAAAAPTAQSYPTGQAQASSQAAAGDKPRIPIWVPLGSPRCPR